MEKSETFDKGYTKRALILFAAFIIIVMYIETMLVPSLPAIAQQFNINAAEVSLVVSLYLVSGVALSPIVGKLGDIYGKKRMLNYLLPIYVVSLAFTGFAPNYLFLIIARTIQGIGLTIFPLVVSLIREEFPREEVPRATAIIAAMFGVGSAIGLPIGSLVSNSFGWQATYHTALPFVLLFAILIMKYARESKYKRPDAKVDYIGAIGLAIGLAMVVFGLSEGTSYGWTSPLILTLLIVGAAALVALHFYERRLDEPVLNQRLLRIRNVMSANLIVLVVGFSFFFSYQAYAYMFESPAPLGFGLSIFETGLAMLPFALANVIVAPLAGKWIPKTGVKPFFIAGGIVSIVGFAISALAPDVVITLIGETLAGLGVVLINVPTINLLVLSIEPKEMGLATSMNAVFRFLGSTLGAPVSGLFIAQFVSRTAFTYDFYLAIAVTVVGIIVSMSAEEILGKNKKVQEIEEKVSV
ncbi:MAG: MFS transporter [Candidatus Micrarchaeota archaeon]|nr:MFS transporter [Candidatus Micrarchaeota archaeon]